MDLQNMLRKQAVMAQQKIHYICELLIFNSLKIGAKHTGKLKKKRCQVSKGEEKNKLFSCILGMLTPLRKVALKRKKKRGKREEKTNKKTNHKNARKYTCSQS